MYRLCTYSMMTCLPSLSRARMRLHIADKSSCRQPDRHAHTQFAWLTTRGFAVWMHTLAPPVPTACSNAAKTAWYPAWLLVTPLPKYLQDRIVGKLRTLPPMGSTHMTALLACFRDLSWLLHNPSAR